MYFDQTRFDLRCEWGLAGLRTVAADVNAVVIVDVLSFSTAVDIAVTNGASVYPYRWKDETAREFAAERRAMLAEPRREPGRYSLSPASLRSIRAASAIVLPSPNGSTLSLSTGGIPTFTACLRNAPAVAHHAAMHGSRIAVIPAGERWPDGSIRPAVEDLLGAGAVLAALRGRRSPEAEAAIAAFESARGRLPDMLAECSSGRELIEPGFREDVAIAAEYAVSPTAPVLAGERFVAA